MMDELVNQMNKLLADAFTLYLKAHYYHWNVEGSNFPQYHEFLGELYEEIFGSVDNIAEHIRALNAYAPGTLIRFKELTSITETISVPSAEAMFLDLFNQNKQYLGMLMTVYVLADRFNELGLANFLQDRMAAHKKHEWMLRSILKKAENE
jgi:starvation-inducible DNA-binding protein